MHKFENLEVWKISLEYLDLVYSISDGLPREEEYNLKSQMRRAATSVALNIAEGSTGQSDHEQARFIGHAIRSLTEVVACLRIIARRRYPVDSEKERMAEEVGLTLVRKLQALRNSLEPNRRWLKELVDDYAPESSGGHSE